MLALMEVQNLHVIGTDRLPFREYHLRKSLSARLLQELPLGRWKCADSIYADVDVRDFLLYDLATVWMIERQPCHRPACIERTRYKGTYRKPVTAWEICRLGAWPDEELPEEGRMSLAS